MDRKIQFHHLSQPISLCIFIFQRCCIKKYRQTALSELHKQGVQKTVQKSVGCIIRFTNQHFCSGGLKEKPKELFKKCSDIGTYIHTYMHTCIHTYISNYVYFRNTLNHYVQVQYYWVHTASSRKYIKLHLNMLSTSQGRYSVLVVIMLASFSPDITRTNY